MFFSEPFVDCLRADIKQTFYYFTPGAVVMVLHSLLTFTYTFEHERACIYILTNLVLCHAILSMMMTNMSKKPFYLLHPAYLFQLVPLAASVTGLLQETMIVRVCCVLALVTFYLRIATISKQWLDHSGRTFFLR